MNNFTPQQKLQLEAWAAERDKILGEISVAKTEKEAKLKENIALGESNKEIEGKINQGLGRLAEIDRSEEARKELVSKELVDLEAQKTVLQTTIPILQKEVDDFHVEKQDLIDLIKNLIEVHKEMFGRTGELNQILGNVEKVSAENISDLNTHFESLKKNVSEIIALNTENVGQTRIILEKLPRYIFELQKPIPIRRPIIGPAGGPEEVRTKLEIKPEKK